MPGDLFPVLLLLCSVSCSALYLYLYHGGLVPAACGSEALHQLNSTERHWQEAGGWEERRSQGISLLLSQSQVSLGSKQVSDDSSFTR